MNGNIKPATAKDYTRPDGACSAVLLTEDNLAAAAAWVNEEMKEWSAGVEDIKYRDGKQRTKVQVVVIRFRGKPVFRVGPGHYLVSEMGTLWRWPRVLFRGLHEEERGEDEALLETYNQ